MLLPIQNSRILSMHRPSKLSYLINSLRYLIFFWPAHHYNIFAIIFALAVPACLSFGYESCTFYASCRSCKDLDLWVIFTSNLNIPGTRHLQRSSFITFFHHQKNYCCLATSRSGTVLCKFVWYRSFLVLYNLQTFWRNAGAFKSNATARQRPDSLPLKFKHIQKPGSHSYGVLDYWSYRAIHTKYGLNAVHQSIAISVSSQIVLFSIVVLRHCQQTKLKLKIILAMHL